MSDQDKRRAAVRRHAAQAAHHLTEALTTDDPGTLVELIGQADLEITAARNETLRGHLG